MSLSRNEIIKQSFDNLKKRIGESPTELAKFSYQLDNLEEAIELLVDDNRRLETCWSKMTNKLIDLKLRLNKASNEVIYTIGALISTSGLKLSYKPSEMVHYNRWIIVKHAGFSSWSKYFMENPNNGCEITASCAGSIHGRRSKIKAVYDDKNEALKDLIVINKSNPNGDYAVCPLLEPVRTRKDFYKG